MDDAKSKPDSLRIEEENMYDRILVPLDGSEFSEAILRHVETLALDHDSKVVLLEVIDDRVESTLSEFVRVEGLSTAREAAEIYLHQIAVKLRSKGVEVECVVDFGDPARRIAEQAESRGITGIVMSTHGRSGLNRLLHGSVAERVSRLASVPVLKIRPAVEVDKLITV